MMQRKHPNIEYSGVPIEGILNPDLGVRKGIQGQVIPDLRKPEGLVRKSTKAWSQEEGHRHLEELTF